MNLLIVVTKVYVRAIINSNIFKLIQRLNSLKEEVQQEIMVLIDESIITNVKK